MCCVCRNLSYTCITRVYSTPFGAHTQLNSFIHTILSLSLSRSPPLFGYYYYCCCCCRMIGIIIFIYYIFVANQWRSRDWLGLGWNLMAILMEWNGYAIQMCNANHNKCDYSFVSSWPPSPPQPPFAIALHITPARVCAGSLQSVRIFVVVC